MAVCGCPRISVLTLLGLLFLAALPAAATPMPEFGNSVTFDESGPDITLSKLTGKAVLVIFCQSWCGICNGWAPDLIKQVEAAHASNRALVLIAIKTDGGGIMGAKEYLKSKGADLDKWCVGSDLNATYYKQVCKDEGLWRYALVDGEGELVTLGFAGSRWKDGPNAKQYSLASKDLLKTCGTVTPVLPADKEYPAELGRIVRFAEAGSLGKALSLCGTGPGAVRAKNAAAQQSLRQDLLGVAEARIRKEIDSLTDTKREGALRYASYKALTAMVKEFSVLPAAQQAGPILAKAGTDPVIQKEKSAEAAYTTTMQKLQKASKSDKPRLLKELGKVATTYEGTTYGQLAAKAGEEDGAAQ